MSKLTLDAITSGYGTVDALNRNFDAIEEALENTVSRDGTLPNGWLADQDANDFRLLNLPAPQGSSDPVRLVDLQDAAVETDFPSQAGNAGKFLKTDGTTASWATVDPGVISLTASDIANVPSGTIAATNVQTALNELGSEKAPIDSPTFTGTPSLPTGTTGVTQAASENSTKLATTAFVQSYLPSGMLMDYAGASVPTGWLECDGSAVSRATYAGLFTAISTTWGAGNGTTTFNIPDFRGKARIGKGTGVQTASGVDADVDITANSLAVPTNTNKWITGQTITFTLASGTVTGLVSGNTYYVIRINSTTIKLASTLALAQAGTPIDYTAKSSPVWSISYTLASRTLAETGGEEAHAMSSTELLLTTVTGGSHSHQLPYNITNSAGANKLVTAGTNSATPENTVASGSLTMNPFGGNAAMNVMPPFGVTMTIIKT